MKGTVVGRSITARSVVKLLFSGLSLLAGITSQSAAYAHCAVVKTRQTHNAASISGRPMVTSCSRVRGTYNLDSVTRILRLKLYLDQFDYDDIVIGFNAGATPMYNFNQDSRYLPGTGAAEGLASYSSDGVPLSINLLPLPNQGREAIRLEVNARNSGPITLKRTELDSLPDNYAIWLVDKYQKDSVNLRTDSNYVFTINKADTASFGSYRFSVVITNTTTAGRLTAFNAVKGLTGADISWTMQNEGNNTHFCVERSIDHGVTFKVIDSITSCSAGTYEATDRNPPAAADEYRLKITAPDSTVTYSSEITLLYTNSLAGVSGNLTVFPNPTSDMLNISIVQSAADTSGVTYSLPGISAMPSLAAKAAAGIGTVYTIQIINVTGSVITKSTSTSDSWEDNISGLKPGAYVIQVFNKTNNTVVGIQSFIKM